jgi:SNF2 family DNA or RNA helicase
MTSEAFINQKQAVNMGLGVFKRRMAEAGFDEKKHQIDGVRWCLLNEHHPNPPYGVRGGLVADEMGLGKTNTMIGLVMANVMSRTLVVVPPALLDQWRRALLVFGLDVLVWHGEEKRATSVERLAEATVVLTTYGGITEGVRRRRELMELEWGRVVFDEAHHLRNKNTKKYAGARELKAEYRWLVTGTPIQNGVRDFYSLCDCIGLPPIYYRERDNLKQLAAYFILRRTKAEVGIEYPEAVFETAVVDWESEEERGLALDIHRSLRFCHVGERGGIVNLDGVGGGFNHLGLMIRSRQVCVYPGLVKKMVDDLYVDDGEVDGEGDQGEVDGEGDGGRVAVDRALSGCSKLNAVVETIKKNGSGGAGVEGSEVGKKIVFCHFRQEIDELMARLEAEDVRCVAIDGRTSQAQKETILQGTDAEVLVLQIQTCCEGLNLQEYSQVYFVSPHWNPAVEDQAVGRCHRMGQTKQVKVFRFQMAAFNQDECSINIENYVAAVQEEKKEIAADI